MIIDPAEDATTLTALATACDTVRAQLPMDGPPYQDLDLVTVSRQLSGLGDLSLTCGSIQSRNFAAGCALGAGETRPGGTVEGVATARAACQLGARHGVELPIATAVADVLEGTATLADAMDALLSRPLRERRRPSRFA